MGTGDRGRRCHGKEENKLAVRSEWPTTTRVKAKPTTVLFCEYSKGGDLQSKLKGVADRLSPLVGFKMRVTEMGGTKLGILLSNKNLWSGMECTRHECRPCIQTGGRTV